MISLICVTKDGLEEREEMLFSDTKQKIVTLGKGQMQLERTGYRTREKRMNKVTTKGLPTTDNPHQYFNH